MDEVVAHNRRAWNAQSTSGESRWCQPVDSNTTELAAKGQWSVILTPTKAVPQAWFGDLAGIDLLALASGGGQQAPILAAAGAKVTSFDNSDEQLAKDKAVAVRDELDLQTVQGDMADLSCFPDANFDLIFHPVSNVFAADVLPVWRECFRVLKPGGRLLAGFMNPDFYLFDHEAIEAGADLLVTHSLPYQDVDQSNPDLALEFSHSFESQIGGQLASGFHLLGFYEDRWEDSATPLNRYMATSFATCSVKPGAH